MKRAAIGVVVFAIVVGFLFWQYSGDIFTKKQEGPITLTYWVTEDDDAVIKSVADNYTRFHPNVQIKIVKQSLLNYRTRLQTQIRAGQGPDIFQLHSSWLPMLTPDLAPLSEDVLSTPEYTHSFYPIIKDTLMVGGKPYAIPTEIDGLVLFYNEEILQGAGVGAPKNWQEFVEDARKVTVRNQNGQIQTAGAAMGTTTNVDYWSEILSLLFFQQPEGNILSPANKSGGEVVQFYTSFVTDPRNKTWDVNLPTSTQMFAQGKLAFYFAPARQASVIRQLNPNLQFKVTTVPQLPGKTVGLATFWAEGVSSRSLHSTEAWQFLKYLTSPQILQVLNQQRGEAQLLAKAYPRVEMASEQNSDPILSAVILQAPYFKSFYLNSDTQDVGMNQEMMSSFGNVINSVLQGTDTQSALSSTGSDIQQIIDKYTKPAQQSN